MRTAQHNSRFGIATEQIAGKFLPEEKPAIFN